MRGCLHTKHVPCNLMSGAPLNEQKGSSEAAKTAKQSLLRIEGAELLSVMPKYHNLK